jgi:hypothetical protein
MRQRYFYLEFDPRNFKKGSDLIMSCQDLCREEHGKYFEQFDLQVGKLPANAELYFLKAEIWLPFDHSNNNYLI